MKNFARAQLVFLRAVYTWVMNGWAEHFFFLWSMQGVIKGSV